MKLILCGGGSGEQNILANKKLNEIIDNNKPILYVPLAMDEKEHPYDKCYEWITEELKNVGKSGIDMVRSFKEFASKNFTDYGAIFIGGGNTYKLLKGLKESGAFEKLKKYINNNGVIIGGSAGAVIFGKDINIISVMDVNDVKLDDTKGFDMITGISIFPHYTNAKSKLTEQENIKRHHIFTNYICEYSKNNGKVFAIPEEDAIYVNDDYIEIIGTRPYFISENGNISEYQIENISIKDKNKI